MEQLRSCLPPIPKQPNASTAFCNASRIGRTKADAAQWLDLNGGFRLPDGSRLAPDAAWFDETRWQRARAPGVRLPVFVPEFVIELRSPDDRLPIFREKMQNYMANCVQLAWLIDPARREVSIYRPGSEPEVLRDPESVQGEGPVEGFVLRLDRILR